MQLLWGKSLNIGQCDSGERCGPWASCYLMYYFFVIVHWSCWFCIADMDFVVCTSRFCARVSTKHSLYPSNHWNNKEARPPPSYQHPRYRHSRCTSQVWCWDTQYHSLYHTDRHSRGFSLYQKLRRNTLKSLTYIIACTKKIFYPSISKVYCFWPVLLSDRASIFYMYVSCDKTFLLVPWFMTSWLWPYFDLFLKNFNICHIFWLVSDRDFMCVFLVTRPGLWTLTYF